MTRLDKIVAIAISRGWADKDNVGAWFNSSHSQPIIKILLTASDEYLDSNLRGETPRIGFQQ